MDSLVRRIKDLDQITFQQLCFHVISERFPSAKVRYPEGAAGDEGVDLFQGDLTQGPTVWQCKAFTVTILGDSQKSQIKKSLQDAVKNVQPKLWILCLNLSLGTKAMRWFQRLQESYARLGIMVADPFDAMELARELMFRRTIRNHFFSNLALDVQELKSLMMAVANGKNAIDNATLEKLATENTEEYLDRLTQQDSRFTFEVTFGGERGPTAIPPRNEPHLVSSMTDGRKIVKAYARDHEALRQDPVGSSFHFSESGAQKFTNFIRTGKNQTWDPQEIRTFKSTIPLLSAMRFKPGELGMSVQSIPDDRPIPLKLTFFKEDHKVTLDYVEFRRVRSGAEEVEIATIGIQPLGITFVLPFNTVSAVTATISTNLPGEKIREVAKAAAALKLLQTGCMVELTSLKVNGHLCTLAVSPLPLRFKPRFFKFIEELAAIAERFNVDFLMPSTLELTREEEEAFLILRAFALNEPLDINRFTAIFIKCPENAIVVPQQFRDNIVLRLEHQQSMVTLFGTTIQLGPTRMRIDRAEVLQQSATLNRFAKARIGTAVPIALRPLIPVRFELMDRAAFMTPNT